jgi:hypothetical protein
MAASTMSGYTSADVGTTVTIPAYTYGSQMFGDGTATVTITGVASGQVTSISSTPASAGSKYQYFGGPYFGFSTYPTGTSAHGGTGLNVQITSGTYLKITPVVESGCQSWTVLKGDTAHALGYYQDIGSGVFIDAGVNTIPYSTPTLNTTGDAYIYGKLTLATVANFTSCGTSTSCAAPVALTPRKVVYSGVPFSSSTTLALTGMPAFTSITSYACFVTDTTHPAYTFGAANQSTTATTLTASTSNSDTVVVECDGY